MGTANQLARDQWTEQIFCLGVPGSGKSYRARAIVKTACRPTVAPDGDLVVRRLVVHDPVGNWRNEWDMRHPKTGERMELLPWRTHRRKGPYTFIENDADLLNALEHEQDCVFVFDELGDVDDVGAHAMRSFRALCRKRRHKRVTIVACAQRPSRIPVETYAFCSKIYVYRIQHRDDLQRLEGLWPDKERAKQGIDVVSNLSIQRHEFLLLRFTEKS